MSAKYYKSIIVLIAFILDMNTAMSSSFESNLRQPLMPDENECYDISKSIHKDFRLLLKLSEHDSKMAQFQILNTIDSDTKTFEKRHGDVIVTIGAAEYRSLLSAQSVGLVVRIIKEADKNYFIQKDLNIGIFQSKTSLSANYADFPIFDSKSLTEKIWLRAHIDDELFALVRSACSELLEKIEKEIPSDKILALELKSMGLPPYDVLVEFDKENISVAESEFREMFAILLSRIKK